MATEVVNRRIDSFDIYIGRPTIWGNPYTHLPEWVTVKEIIGIPTIRVASREEAVNEFRQYAIARLRDEPAWLEPLRDKVLACWCKPLACHGDVIVELLDGR